LSQFESAVEAVIAGDVATSIGPSGDRAALI
jgi:hypothetical protein